MTDEPTGGGTPPGAPDRVRRRAVALLVGLAGAAVGLDILTKELAVRSLDPSDPQRLLGGAVYLSLTRNSGAAFSLMQDKTFVFPLIAVAVVTWIAWMSRRLRSAPWAVSLGLILGGAVGNLLDRIFRAPGPFQGHVVDFVSLVKPYGDFFPIFNVADTALTCGVVLAILLELTGRHRDGSRVVSETARDGDTAVAADGAARRNTRAS